MLNRRSFLLLGLGSALPLRLPEQRPSPMSKTPHQTPLDRQAIVARHNVRRTQLSTRSPLQVGNGEFAFGADITGLQTFVPFNTMSHWGWHAAPLPPGPGPAEFQGQSWETHGHAVRYPIPNPEQPALQAYAL